MAGNSKISILTRLTVIFILRNVESKLSEPFLTTYFSDSNHEKIKILQESGINPLEEISKITNYGCWCNFQQNPSQPGGFGEAVDNFDSACRQLIENYICCSEETYYQGNECQPWNVDWAEIEQAYDTDDQMFDHCKAMNSMDPCSVRACIIEQNFIDSVIGELMSGNLPQDRYNRNGLEGFNHRDHCGNGGGPKQPPKVGVTVSTIVESSTSQSTTKYSTTSKQNPSVPSGPKPTNIPVMNSSTTKLQGLLTSEWKRPLE